MAGPGGGSSGPARPQAESARAAPISAKVRDTDQTSPRPPYLIEYRKAAGITSRIANIAKLSNLLKQAREQIGPPLLTAEALLTGRQRL
jgi:hypothetical protein